jgi:hypothetical protein
MTNISRILTTCQDFIAVQSLLVLKIGRRHSWVTSLAPLQADQCGGDAEVSTVDV